MSTVNFNFSGERFVITGASSGIGRQTALELVKSGAEILAIGRSSEKLEALKKENPEKICTAAFDVTDSEALELAIKNFVQEKGKLNGAVHAAGISDMTPLKFYSVETVKKIMDVNFIAGMELLRLVTKSKYSDAGTSTVLFSSIAAITAAKGMFAYAASKAAINSAIRSVASEISSKRHRVNSVLPGWVITPMTESLSSTHDIEAVLAKHLLGAGKPEDVTGIILFLLSDAARWITGSNIVADGGGGYLCMSYLNLREEK